MLAGLEAWVWRLIFLSFLSLSPSPPRHSRARHKAKCLKNDLHNDKKVRQIEQVVDDLNEQIFRELLTFMMEDSKSIHRALLIMQVSKNLERIADHAKGIADMVTYMVTGECVRHQTCDLKEKELA